MINIAICDDNISHAEQIEKLIKNLQSCFIDGIHIHIYYSGESFCRAIEDHCPFDIVLMDIEMEGIDGIGAGKKLRENDDNDWVLLLYISSHESYYRQLFDVQPYGFIGKPIKPEEFSDKIKKAIHKVLRHRDKGKRKILPIYQKGREILIPFQKIVYLESKIRVIHMLTTDGMIKYYSTLSKEEEKLSNDEFVRTHQSYIVNLHHVKVISNNYLTLLDSQDIPISSNRRDSVKNRYMNYRRNYFE